MTTRGIAAVGPSGFVLGFKLAGLDQVHPIDDVEPGPVFQEVFGGDAAIVVCRSEDVQALPRRLRDRVTESVDPVFVQLGAGAGAGLREKVRNAIGIDLFKE